ncbi:hypothetical protein B0H63DRAFT_111046 [Podospora didyma]|uniref:Gamma interferon inducible lysosomal thiol reductase n=1 Tax=Podospora didyma TaxID=330526 RepID=A0AAE0NZ53_9PEZI|nr:hypothetical protein B0H63DRAFT_111046 [Podospora didyma]
MPELSHRMPTAMDEKQRSRSMSPLRRSGPGRGRRALSAVVLFLGFAAIGRFLIWAHAQPTETTVLPMVSEHPLVPLEAHIMSKCPDAKDCLKQLVLPAMQRVYDKVNFTLSFIGTPTDNDGVACKHGPEECLGNIIELCAQKLYPEPKTFLGFTMCLTRDYNLIPQRSLVEDCALEHAIDFRALNDCATKDDGALGMGMLRDSVQRSANVSKHYAENL